MDHHKLKLPGRQSWLLKALGALSVLLFFAAPLYAQSSNNECTGATTVPASAPNPVYTDLVDTRSNTSNPADPSLSCNGNGAQTDGNTAWYKWTPSADVAVNISTVGSIAAGGGDLDTAHGVFTGSCAALTEVACVDQGLTDNLFFEATGGVTYFLKFGEFLDGAGGGDLVVTLEPPPEPEQLILESTRDGMSPRIDSLVARCVTDCAAGNPTPAGSNTIDALQIFDGAENDDNAIVLGTLIAPPDTNGDVGISHYVQMANLLTTIFDKSGNIVLGPFGSNRFWTGFGGACETTNRGDPIVLYDEETDRWFVSQFAYFNGPGDFLCIAVSKTGDPTGEYYLHEFEFTDIGFPDYPKFGFVTDAISVMVNLFSPFQGAGLGAIDKDEAMTAGPTTMVFFKVGTNEFGFLPADNDGPVFNNTPPTFFTNNGGSGDRIDVWEITPDFGVPTNSTIAEVAKIPVTPFDSTLCGASRVACIDQPGSGTGEFPNNIRFLEGITDRLMHRLQLRDFGKRKQVVANHTIDASGNGDAGVRWYEFWNDKGKGWKLKKENTFNPDSDHRWMASVAMNAKGETCLGYSISSQTTYPSIGVAARRGTANHMNMGELVVFDGNVAANVQTRTARWGDYSAMAVDPVDDTCWFTTEFAKPNSFIGEQFGWATKIVQFDLKGNN
ncbi:MAG: hypothetical protein MUO51_15225 [Woeseiaceae bacterium]|nr:hypothetical protein [Woeseiaceae bacterium]